MKKCNNCHIDKPLEGFSLDKYSKDGHRYICKTCSNLSYKIWEENNKDRVNANRRQRRKNPLTAIVFAQRDRQRSLFKIKGVYKNQAQTQQIREWLGCSIEECKKHIENQFKTGMNWSNRGVGRDKWQIDHIIPASLSEIDHNGVMLDTPLNRRIWHYTNLQPLWHVENAIKSDKYEFT